MTKNEVAEMIVWFDENKQSIKDECIKAAENANAWQCFDLDNLFNTQSVIMKVAHDYDKEPLF